MRFSTIVSSLTIVLAAAAGVSASCRAHSECGRGRLCKFRSAKDSMGECFKRGEGPPYPKVKRSYNIDERDLDDLYEEFYARYFDDELDL